MSEGANARVECAVLAQIAAVLFVNGQTSEGIRLSFARLARAFGLEVSLFAHWGLLALVDGDGRPIKLMPAEPTAVDIGRVAAAERLVDDVCTQTISPQEAIVAVGSIDRRPPVGLLRFAGMAGTGAAALAVIFGATNAITLCLIAAVAGSGACLRRGLSHWSGNPFLQPFAAALLAGLAGGALAQVGTTFPGAPPWGSKTSHGLLVICPCMVLVPGPHFLNGAIELARAHLALGLARIAYATLVVLAICSGVLVGLALTGASFPVGDGTPSVPLTYDVIAAGIAVAAYGAFFNMPWRMLPAPIGIGMLAHGMRWGLLQHGASLQLGALVACLVVGSLMTPVTHRLRMPFGACAFSAVVSLIPGAYMFAAAAGLMGIAAPNANVAPEAVSSVLVDATDATAILLAMTAGIIVPKIVFDAFGKKRRQSSDRQLNRAEAPSTLTSAQHTEGKVP